MKIYRLVVLVSLLISSSLYAQSYDQKRLQVGFGVYNLTVNYNNSFDYEFSGTAISAAYAPTDNLSFRVSFYSLDNDDFSALESSGYDLVIYGGTGLATQGFKIYGGGGIYSDTWELNGFEDDFSGVQLSGGLGYNWEVVALDFVIGIRSTSDYEDELSQIGLLVDTVTTSSLTLSMRF